MVHLPPARFAQGRMARVAPLCSWIALLGAAATVTAWATMLCTPAGYTAYPGDGQAALPGAGMGLTAGIVQIAALGFLWHRPVGRTAARVGGGLVTAVAVLTSTVLVATGTTGVQHTLADTVGDTASGAATSVAWTWEPGADVSVDRAEALPSGILMVLRDGVVALDDFTGRERWRYRTPGERVDVLLDRHTGEIMVGGDHDSGPTVLLDPETGATVEAADVRGPETGWTTRTLADGVLLAGSEPRDSFVLRADDPLTGERLWELDTPPECLPHSDGGDELVSWDTAEGHLIAGFVCADDPISDDDGWEERQRLNRVEVRALDLADGSTSWVHTTGVGEFPYLVDVVASRDGAHVFVQAVDPDDRDRDTLEILEAATGAEVASGSLNEHTRVEPMVGASESGFLARAGDTYTWLAPDGTVRGEVEWPSEGQRGTAVMGTGDALHTLGWASPTDRSVRVQVHPWDGSGPRHVLDRFSHLETDGPRRLVPTSAGAVVTVQGDDADGVVRVIGLA
jgi:outer membrane protein assembly factor BamB